MKYYMFSLPYAVPSAWNALNYLVNLIFTHSSRIKGFFFLEQLHSNLNILLGSHNPWGILGVDGVDFVRIVTHTICHFLHSSLH